MKITKIKIGALVAALAVASSITAFAANGEQNVKAELISAKTVASIPATEIPKGAVALQKEIIADDAIIATTISLDSISSTDLPEGTVFMNKIVEGDVAAATLVAATEIVK